MRTAGTTLICTAMKPHREVATLGSAVPHDRGAYRPCAGLRRASRPCPGPRLGRATPRILPVMPEAILLTGRDLTLEAVEAVARALVSSRGPGVLDGLAKTHFKTTSRVR